MAHHFAAFMACGACAAWIASAGCSSSPAQTAANCNTDQVCPSGQTCWPVTATTLQCIPSETGAAFGTSCIEQYDKATCADGMLCDATGSTGNGTCTTYCSETEACQSGYSCRTTQVGSDGPFVSICRLTTATSPEDAGTPPEDGSIGVDAELGNFDASLGPDSTGVQQ